MPITFNTTNINSNNITLIRNKINAIRVKHNLGSTTFSTLQTNIQATEYVEARNKTTELTASKWISSVNTTSLNHIATGVLVKQSDLQAFSDVLDVVDGVCAHDAVFTDRSHDSDKSNYNTCNDCAHDKTDKSVNSSDNSNKSVYSDRNHTAYDGKNSEKSHTSCPL